MGPTLHIRRKRLLVNIVLFAVLYAVLAVVLPWFVFVPVAVVVMTLHVYYEAIHASKRYQGLLDEVHTVHGESVGPVARISAGAIDETVYNAFKELVSELERKNFQLVEKNIQLLSIKEIGLTLVSSLDESKVVDAVINFLNKGLGYRELFVSIFHQDKGVFSTYVFRDTAKGHRYQEVAMPLEELDGLLRKSVQMQQSVLIRDPDMHPIGTIAQKPLFEDSTMGSYVVVPLIKSGATQDCDKKPDCILHMNQVDRERASMDGGYTCPGCGRVPILGLLGVTDGFKATSLSKVDLVSVETLAVQLSTMLENNRLFAELKQEENYRANVINSMMNGLVTVDKSGMVLFANATAAELTGYDIESMRGMNITDLITDGQKEGGENPILRTLRKGRKSFQQEALVKKRNGRMAPVILNTSFLVDKYRSVQGVLAVFDDITRIKRMEEQIVHLDKLAALGRFSSSIAHEIRNPLTGIAAGIQYLQRAGEVAESQLDNIAFILDEVNRIDRLIGDLMNVVRVSDLMYEKARLEEIIDNSIVGMGQLARKNEVTLKKEFPKQTREVFVDADRITQVMINLIKNAIEASKPGSEVFVTLAFPIDVTDVLFDAVREFAIIEVRDRGLGLSEEEKSRVFEPFFSKKADGTGLGRLAAGR